MKNVLDLILKALLVFKIFEFLSWLFGLVEKTAWLKRQGKFQNLWCRKLVTKFGQLIEYNKRNIFL